uniref:Histone H2A C-terminal domain-containing protein n=1 Tax=Nelumbo nucifera TaxID=4432 RepID=A0A822ZXQ6_NELNU|nr:TPA_asm: hypothetical protein HUJ06_018072 [Nelumbo nucifera]
MDKKKHVFRSSRAGLQFPIGSNGRVGATILEYLTTEVLELELAGNASKEGGEELDILIKEAIVGGGVIPHIYKSLIKTSPKDYTFADWLKSFSAVKAFQS